MKQQEPGLNKSSVKLLTRDVDAILTIPICEHLEDHVAWAPGTSIARGFSRLNPRTRCTLQKLMIFDSLAHQTAKLGV
jgi:hypothetical protein